jgi:hypothetical protein
MKCFFWDKRLYLTPSNLRYVQQTILTFNLFNSRIVRHYYILFQYWCMVYDTAFQNAGRVRWFPWYSRFSRLIRLCSRRYLRFRCGGAAPLSALWSVRRMCHSSFFNFLRNTHRFGWRTPTVVFQRLWKPKCQISFKSYFKQRHNRGTKLKVCTVNRLHFGHIICVLSTKDCLNLKYI